MLKNNDIWLTYSIFIFICFLLNTACTDNLISSKTIGSCTNRQSVAYSGPAERAYCTTNYTHSTPVTITGSARYETRAYGSSGLSASLTTSNIRHAEVIVFDQNNSIVQCAETDSSGQFSLQVPESSENYSIQVYARGSNTFVNASVLNCPEENQIYSVSASFVPDSSKSLGFITASSANSGIMVGAAFNIFDQIVESNNFLRSNAGICPFSGCTTFTVAPKVQAYWEKGFNPNSYFSSSGSAVSFYIPGLSRLFILGGEDGDILNSDTDHFDNSVVIHEYGHFLEDVFSNSDSPGGAHSGNAMIDPRLALGEGWGNFFQAAVRNNSTYRDTFGTPNASPISLSSYIFNIPVEAPASGCALGSLTPGCDLPEFDYEGQFREFSVTRLLWDVFDGSGEGGTDTIDNDFAELWGVLTSATHGLRKSSLEFRGIGHLHEAQGITGASDWSSLQTEHKHNNNTQEYARYVEPGTCSRYLIDPYSDPNDNGSFATSHLVRNNNFFHFKHTGGPVTLQMKATVVDSSGGYINELEPDIDLYLYNKSGRIGNSSDIVSSSDNYWDNDPNTGDQSETISLSSLAAGDYLIQVRVFTGRYMLDNSSSTTNCIGSGVREICEDSTAPFDDFIPAGSPTNYEIEFNGVDLCPATLP